MAELTIPEAAVALGLSTDTVRRRIRAGALASRTDARGRYLVDLPEATAPRPPAEQDAARRELVAVRQTCIAAAAAFCAGRPDLGAEDLVALAEWLEAWVTR